MATSSPAAPTVVVANSHASGSGEYQAAQHANTQARPLEVFWQATIEDPVAFYTMILAIATIGLWIFTALMWRVTRRAVIGGESAAQAAVRAAQAAENSLAHARASADRQQRPYVFMDIRLFRQLRAQAGAVNEAIQIEVTWKNMGVTPARRATACLGMQAFDGPMPEDFDFHDLIEPTMVGSIGPGATIVSRYRLPVAQFGTPGAYRQVYYWGWLEYDGFDEAPRSRTEICAKLEWDNDPRTIGVNFTDTFQARFNGSVDGEMLPEQ